MPLTTLQKRAALGLCPSCGGPRDNETCRCTVCRDKHRAHGKDRAARVAADRKAAGLCLQCGVPTTTGTRCPSCAATHSRASKIRLSVVMTERQKHGLCIQCGNPRDNETVRCSTCREIHNVSTATANRMNTAEREAAGLCTICGGTRDQNTKICSACLNDAAARNYRIRSAKREVEGVCRDCGAPTWSAHTKRCKYHYTYGILHNFMPRVTREMVEAIAAKLEAQEFKCALTGVPIVPGKNASLDHVLPRTKYSELAAELTNLVWVDHSVNVMKQNITPEDPMLDVLFAPALVARIRDLASKVIRPQ